MKFKFIFFVLFIFYLRCLHLNAQIHIEGNINSSLYAWEMTEDKTCPISSGVLQFIVQPGKNFATHHFLESRIF